MKLRPWVKLPTQWIEEGGLRDFRWAKGKGAANVSAIVLLIVMAHHAHPDTGEVRITYDKLCERASLSRAMVSAGLDVLASKGLLETETVGRSHYALTDYDPTAGWGKLPAAKLYHNGVIEAFAGLQKRKQVELDAMKLFLLFVARRDNSTNMALLNYDQIEERSGVARARIKPALSMLCAMGLIQIEHLPRRFGEPGVASGYRLTHVDSHRHMGTIGRTLDPISAGFEQL